MKIYGLTGGIACGKSTVSEILTELGAAVVDADEASRLVMKPGQNAYKEINECMETRCIVFLPALIISNLYYSSY